MNITGTATLHAPAEQVWDALLDPAVLVRTIPGCERLETVGDNAYDMTVTVGVAAIRGTYAGSCALRDLDPHRSLVLSAQGAGAAGTIAADVEVGFNDSGDGTTEVTYAADTTVGGMIGGVGQRMLGSVSKRLAGEFFAAVDQALAAPAPAAAVADGTAAGPPRSDVHSAPPRSAAVASQQDFAKGVAVGAGLVALGVLLGVAAGRRR